MMKFGKGGYVLTGVGAYLIFSKIVSAVRGSVRDVSEAIKWRAYYKYGNPDAVPPGYSVTTKNGEVDSQEPSSEDAGKAVSEVIRKSINNLFDKPEAKETPVESDTDSDSVNVIDFKEALRGAYKTTSETAEEVTNDIADSPTIETEKDEDE